MFDKLLLESLDAVTTGAVACLVTHGANPNMCNEEDVPILLDAITRNLFDYSLELIRNGAILTEEMRKVAKTAFDEEYQVQLFALADSLKK